MANASDAVIELGSSDEEIAPAPKKLKLTSNAMVHIPANLDNITIKPVRSKPSSLIKPLPKVGKQVQVTKVQNTPTHRLQVKKSITAVNIPIQHGHKKHIQGPLISSMSINPVNIVSKLNRPQLTVNRLSSKVQSKHIVPVKNSKNINLPPSITVKKTYSRLPAIVGKIKQPIIKKKPVSTVPPTVDIADDEESPGSPLVGPQWYLRPEQVSSAATTISKPEQENNKEPKTNLVEITIEDSPVKSSKGRCFEVGIEYPITIEDSPLKLTTNNCNDKSSDEETSGGKVRKSKKKLNYPIETDVVEIELEPLEIDSNTGDIPPELSKEVTKGDVDKNDDEKRDLDYSDSTKVSQDNSSMPRKDIPEESEEKVENDKEDTFNSTYQTFINLCLKLEDSDDMKKIVEKKIKGYHRQVPREFTESEEFNDIVHGKTVSMEACPEKMYLYIKDIVDELNTQRKLAKSKPLNETKDIETQKFLYGENSQFDHKRQRQIRKLEKALKKLHIVIEKLEEQEVDFDDDEESVYLLTASDDGSSSSDIDNELERNKNELLKRYKERMVRVHAKLCQLTNTRMPSEPPVYIGARPGHNAGPAKKLEKWVNRKVPIGGPLPFPDFHDVLQCVREANEEDKLGWNEAMIKEEAQDLFTRCGKILQRRRQENEWRIAVSRISSELDPADESEELKKKLDENGKLAAKREVDVFNKYADRQKLLKLEAEEIDDKEANESPEDDDEEDDDVICEASTSSSDKVKRKRKLEELISKKENKTESQNRDKDSLDADVDLEPKNKKPKIVENKDKTKENEEIELLSSEDMVSSDIDQLHLLQKLKPDVYNSSPYESQTDIVISDTTESDNVASNNVMSKGDMISIENSSYSESDTNIASKDHLLYDNDNVQEIDECRSANELSDDGQENEKNYVHIDRHEEDLLITLSDDEGSNQQKSPDNGPCNLKDANNAKPKINNDSPPSVNKDIVSDISLENKEDEISSKMADDCVHSVKNDNVNNIVDDKKLENNEKSISKLNNNGNEDVVMTEHRDEIAASDFETNGEDVIMSEEVGEKNDEIKNSDTLENRDVINENDHDCGIIEKNNTPSLKKSDDYSKNENKVVDVTVGTSLIDKEDVLLEEQDTGNLEKSLENNEETCSSQLNTEDSKDVDKSGNDENNDMETDNVEEIKIIGFESLDEEIFAKITDSGSVEDGYLLDNKVLVEKVTNTDSMASLNCEIVLKEKASKDSKECSEKIENVQEDEFKKVDDMLEKIISSDL